MSTQIKILVGLLAIGIVALVVTVFVTDPGDAGAGPDQPGVEHPQVDSPIDPNAVSGEAASHQDAGESRRVKLDLERKFITRDLTGRDFDQGIEGRVVNERGTPVADAKVYLMRALGLQGIKMYRQFQQGQRFPPIAQTITAADGRFRLGVETQDDALEYELRILHDDFCDGLVPNIKPQPTDFWKIGDVKLVTGAYARGLVTNERGLPIAGARVRAKISQSNLNINPTPGRENGIEVLTDTDGRYELPNLSPSLTIALSALARNYATKEVTEFVLSKGEALTVDFRLAAGLEIAGVVVSHLGARLANAKVTLSALSDKSPYEATTSSDAQGRFFFSGLRPGVYGVVVEAQGYVSAEEKPVKAGDPDLTVTVEPLGTVELTVLDDRDRPVRDFHCTLKAALDGKTFGPPIVSQAFRGVTGGKAIMSGARPLTYVAEITSDRFAKNYSEPFTIVEGSSEPAKVTIRLDQGGSIHGVLTDVDGSPIANASLLTRPNKLVDNPLLEIFSVPYTLTKVHARTDKHGKFKLERLYPATYQLKIEHADFTSAVFNDIVVAAGVAASQTEFTMFRGCQFSGVARVKLRPAGQVKVTARLITDEKHPIPFTVEAVSDNEGRFLMPKRLPPGQYEIHATKITSKNQLLLFLHRAKSKKKIEIRQDDQRKSITIDAVELN